MTGPPAVSRTLVIAALSVTIVGVAHGQADAVQPDARAQTELDCGRVSDPDPEKSKRGSAECVCAGDFSRLIDADIYGRELMSPAERDAYRQRLEDAGSSAARKRVEAAHRQSMEKRANVRGVDIEPPGMGIYGGALMTVEERHRFRSQLRVLNSDAQASWAAIHRDEMQARARRLGVPVQLLEATEGIDRQQ